MLRKLTRIELIILGLLILVGVGISVQQMFVTHVMGDEVRYLNNFTIFKTSHFHLLEGKDLYAKYNWLYWDLYKYSPTFALFMGIIAYLPSAVGVIIWNLINILTLFFAVRTLGITKSRTLIFFWLFVLVELVTSQQNAQSNTIIAAFIIWAWSYLEKGKVIKASLMVIGTVFIKLFGIVALALFVVYPKRGKAALATVGWVLILGLLPIIFTGWDELIWQYENWGRMLSADHSASVGYSVLGWLQTWFGLAPNKMLVVLLGAALFCIPLLRFKMYAYREFRRLLLCSVLIWVIIFNHKAESPTFIIAVSGVAIWYFMGERKLYQTILLFLCLIFTVLSPTDIFPPSVRHNFMIPYVLKAVPCIAIWATILVEMMRFTPSEASALPSAESKSK